MLSTFGTVLAAVLALGPLIVFHELGHLVVARLCGVKVLRFSVGFGRILWSRRFGKSQTEWALSAILLGGYVKMLDSRDPDQENISEADLQSEFMRKSVWSRIAITAAGPLTNFFIAIALFTFVGMYGERDVSARLRAVDVNTPAYSVGLRGDETITAVNQVPVGGWTGLRWEIMQAALDKRTATLKVVDASGRERELALPSEALARLNLEGDMLGELGMVVWTPAPAVLEVKPGGAAARAGMLPGDLIRTIDGKPVADSMAATKAVRAVPGRTVAVEVVRAGQPLTLSVTPESVDLGKAGKIGRIEADLGRPQFVTLRAGLLPALAKGADKTWVTSTMTLKMIGRMIIGEASLKNVTGIFTIADYAGQTARMGLAEYLAFIAFISVSLGVMNLLPIPVLDGGFLLYYSLEVLTGRPLPERVIDFAQRAGFVLVVMLMILAHFNDAMRYLF